MSERFPVRHGFELMKILDKNEHVVSMIIHEDRLYVAASFHVWRLEEDKFFEVLFVPLADAPDPPK